MNNFDFADFIRMTFVNRLLFLILLSPAALFGASLDSLISIDNFGNNPGNLKMFVYNESSDSISNTALVIVLHGCGQTAKGVAALTGWNKLARLNHFMLIYPEQKFLNNPDLCFNWFNENDISKGKGECESIYQMVQYVCANYKIDRNRIFISGLSAGAAMSVALMSTHPELWKCGAVFAGTAYKLAGNPLAAPMVMHGKKNLSADILVKKVRDENPDFNGSYPSLIIYQGLKDALVNPVNAKYLIRQWTGIHNCDTIPDKTDSSFASVPGMTRMEFHDGNNKPVVIYYEVNNLRHKLMVKPGDEKNEGGQAGFWSADFNFHSTFQTALDFGIIEE